MPSPASRRAFSLALLSTLALPVLSQDFKWSFTDAALAEGGNIPTCTPLRIRTDPANPDPLFMISYSIGGTPQTQALEQVDGALAYTVRHEVGSTIVLNVADRIGVSGGVSPAAYTVVAGDSIDCVLTPPRAQDFTIHANHTGFELQTCQPWAIALKGGVPPYSVSIASLGAPSVTNVTLDSPEFNVYTYINRVPPNAQVLAAISDSQGRWARGVPLVSTTGAEETACGGAESAGGVATPEQLASAVEAPPKVPDAATSGKPEATGVTQDGPKSNPTSSTNGGNSNNANDDAGSAVSPYTSGPVMLAASLLAVVALVL
ncbi:hypothetical protein BKA70DRAFT_124855 [Coprinopsis sp. MPI-PUGE-AT-0042]|nr:hypothetical protein BKA70DRAFT_124855 [Coprinopsis sp. MPI-PUGE-AT-0042]